MMVHDAQTHADASQNIPNRVYMSPSPGFLLIIYLFILHNSLVSVKPANMISTKFEWLVHLKLLFVVYPSQS